MRGQFMLNANIICNVWTPKKESEELWSKNMYAKEGSF